MSLSWHMGQMWHGYTKGCGTCGEDDFACRHYSGVASGMQAHTVDGGLGIDNSITWL